MAENKKTKYKDLSWPLKVGIVGGWGVLIVYALTFLVGFMLGVMEAGAY